MSLAFRNHGPLACESVRISGVRGDTSEELGDVMISYRVRLGFAEAFREE